MALTPDQWLNLAAGLVLGGLGVAVLFAKRRDRAVVSFAVFALSLAAMYALDPLWGMGDSVPLRAFFALEFLVSIGALGLALWFPAPLKGRTRRDVLVALSIWTLCVLIWHWRRPDRIDPVYAILASFHTIAFLAPMIVFPLRARLLPDEDAGAARSLAIMGIGMGLFTAGGWTLVVAAMGRGELAVPDAAFLLIADVVPLLLWLRATRGRHPRPARNVIVISAAILLVTFALDRSNAAYAYPVGRTIGALVLAYAVLRGQMEGLDLKVRFALSRSTIAAAFIAVFFLASEGAQLFFGQQNEVVGLLAAGALVFAMAPLQRVAERLAERAVPVAQPDPPASSPVAAVDAREARYRIVLRRFLADGSLSREEERALAHLASDLGIDAGRAFVLREETEEEVA